MMKRLGFVLIIILITGIVIATDDVQRIRDWRTNPSMIMAPSDWRFQGDFSQQPQEYLILLPANDGAQTYWTDYPDSTYDYQSFREEIQNGDASYIYNSSYGSYLANEMWITETCPAIIIDSLWYYAWMRMNGSGTGQIKMGVWDITTGWHWASGAQTKTLTGTYSEYKVSFPLDPIDGTAWTPADLNASSATRAWGFENIAIGEGSGVLGLDTQSRYYIISPNKMDMVCFQSNLTMTLDSLGVQFYSAAGSNFKLAIHSGTDKVATTFLDSTTVTTNTFTGWHNLPALIPDQVITAGTYYWISIRLSDYGADIYGQADYATGCHKYGSRSWTFPQNNMLGLPTTTNNNALSLRAYCHTASGENRITQAYIKVFYHGGGTTPMIQTVYKPPIQKIYSAGKQSIYR